MSPGDCCRLPILWITLQMMFSLVGPYPGPSTAHFNPYVSEFEYSPKFHPSTNPDCPSRWDHGKVRDPSRSWDHRRSPEEGSPVGQEPSIEIRAVLVRCPKTAEETAEVPMRGNTYNITAGRSQDILEFHGFDRDEPAHHSETRTQEEFVVVDHVLDPVTMHKARLLNPFVFKVRQEQVLQLYGLKFQSVVNGEAREEVVNKKSANYTGCDDSLENPTCGQMMFDGNPIPYSQGFCCSCDPEVNAERQPIPRIGNSGETSYQSFKASSEDKSDRIRSSRSGGVFANLFASSKVPVPRVHPEGNAEQKDGAELTEDRDQVEQKIKENERFGEDDSEELNEKAIPKKGKSHEESVKEPVNFKKQIANVVKGNNTTDRRKSTSIRDNMNFMGDEDSRTMGKPFSKVHGRSSPSRNLKRVRLSEETRAEDFLDEPMSPVLRTALVGEIQSKGKIEPYIDAVSSQALREEYFLPKTRHKKRRIVEGRDVDRDIIGEFQKSGRQQFDVYRPEDEEYDRPLINLGDVDLTAELLKLENEYEASKKMKKRANDQLIPIAPNVGGKGSIAEARDEAKIYRFSRPAYEKFDENSGKGRRAAPISMKALRVKNSVNVTSPGTKTFITRSSYLAKNSQSPMINDKSYKNGFEMHDDLLKEEDAKSRLSPGSRNLKKEVTSAMAPSTSRFAYSSIQSQSNGPPTSEITTSSTVSVSSSATTKGATNFPTNATPVQASTAMAVVEAPLILRQELVNDKLYAVSEANSTSTKQIAPSSKSSTASAESLEKELVELLAKCIMSDESNSPSSGEQDALSEKETWNSNEKATSKAVQNRFTQTERTTAAPLITRAGTTAESQGEVPAFVNSSTFTQNPNKDFILIQNAIPLGSIQLTGSLKDQYADWLLKSGKLQNVPSIQQEVSLNKFPQTPEAKSTTTLNVLSTAMRNNIVNKAMSSQKLQQNMPHPDLGLAKSAKKNLYESVEHRGVHSGSSTVVPNYLNVIAERSDHHFLGPNEKTTSSDRLYQLSTSSLDPTAEKINRKDENVDQRMQVAPQMDVNSNGPSGVQSQDGQTMEASNQTLKRIIQRPGNMVEHAVFILAKPPLIEQSQPANRSSESSPGKPSLNALHGKIENTTRIETKFLKGLLQTNIDIPNDIKLFDNWFKKTSSSSARTKKPKTVVRKADFVENEGEIELERAPDADAEGSRKEGVLILGGSGDMVKGNIHYQDQSATVINDRRSEEPQWVTDQDYIFLDANGKERSREKSLLKKNLKLARLNALKEYLNKPVANNSRIQALGRSVVEALVANRQSRDEALNEKLNHLDDLIKIRSQVQSRPFRSVVYDDPFVRKNDAQQMSIDKQIEDEFIKITDALKASSQDEMTSGRGSSADDDENGMIRNFAIMLNRIPNVNILSPFDDDRNKMNSEKSLANEPEEQVRDGEPGILERPEMLTNGNQIDRKPMESNARKKAADVPEEENDALISNKNAKGIRISSLTLPVMHLHGPSSSTSFAKQFANGTSVKVRKIQDSGRNSQGIPDFHRGQEDLIRNLQKIKLVTPDFGHAKEENESSVQSTEDLSLENAKHVTEVNRKLSMQSDTRIDQEKSNKSICIHSENASDDEQDIKKERQEQRMHSSPLNQSDDRFASTVPDSTKKTSNKVKYNRLENAVPISKISEVRKKKLHENLVTTQGVNPSINSLIKIVIHDDYKNPPMLEKANDHQKTKEIANASREESDLSRKRLLKPKLQGEGLKKNGYTSTPDQEIKDNVQQKSTEASSISDTLMRYLEKLESGLRVENRTGPFVAREGNKINNVEDGPMKKSIVTPAAGQEDARKTEAVETLAPEETTLAPTTVKDPKANTKRLVTINCVLLTAAPGQEQTNKKDQDKEDTLPPDEETSTTTITTKHKPERKEICEVQTTEQTTEPPITEVETFALPMTTSPPAGASGFKAIASPQVKKCLDTTNWLPTNVNETKFGRRWYHHRNNRSFNAMNVEETFSDLNDDEVPEENCIGNEMMRVQNAGHVRNGDGIIAKDRIIVERSLLDLKPEQDEEEGEERSRKEEVDECSKVATCFESTTLNVDDVLSEEENLEFLRELQNLRKSFEKGLKGKPPVEECEKTSTSEQEPETTEDDITAVHRWSEGMHSQPTTYPEITISEQNGTTCKHVAHSYEPETVPLPEVTTTLKSTTTFCGKIENMEEETPTLPQRTSEPPAPLEQDTAESDELQAPDLCATAPPPRKGCHQIFRTKERRINSRSGGSDNWKEKSTALLKDFVLSKDPKNVLSKYKFSQKVKEALVDKLRGSETFTDFFNPSEPNARFGKTVRLTVNDDEDVDDSETIHKTSSEKIVANNDTINLNVRETREGKGWTTDLAKPEIGGLMAEKNDVLQVKGSNGTPRTTHRVDIKDIKLQRFQQDTYLEPKRRAKGATRHHPSKDVVSKKRKVVMRSNGRSARNTTDDLMRKFKEIFFAKSERPEDIFSDDEEVTNVTHSLSNAGINDEDFDLIMDPPIMVEDKKSKEFEDVTKDLPSQKKSIPSPNKTAESNIKTLHVGRDSGSNSNGRRPGSTSKLGSKIKHRMSHSTENKADMIETLLEMTEAPGFANDGNEARDTMNAKEKLVKNGFKNHGQKKKQSGENKICTASTLVFNISEETNDCSKTFGDSKASVKKTGISEKNNKSKKVGKKRLFPSKHSPKQSFQHDVMFFYDYDLNPDGNKNIRKKRAQETDNVVGLNTDDYSTSDVHPFVAIDQDIFSKGRKTKPKTHNIILERTDKLWDEMPQIQSDAKDKEWLGKMELLRLKKHENILKEYLNWNRDLESSESNKIPSFTTEIASISDLKNAETNCNGSLFDNDMMRPSIENATNKNTPIQNTASRSKGNFKAEFRESSIKNIPGNATEEKVTSRCPVMKERPQFDNSLISAGKILPPCGILNDENLERSPAKNKLPTSGAVKEERKPDEATDDNRIISHTMHPEKIKASVDGEMHSLEETQTPPKKDEESRSQDPLDDENDLVILSMMEKVGNRDENPSATGDKSHEKPLTADRLCKHSEPATTNSNSPYNYYGRQGIYDSYKNGIDDGGINFFGKEVENRNWNRPTERRLLSLKEPEQRGDKSVQEDLQTDGKRQIVDEEDLVPEDEDEAPKEDSSSNLEYLDSPYKKYERDKMKRNWDNLVNKIINTNSPNPRKRKRSESSIPPDDVHQGLNKTTMQKLHFFDADRYINLMAKKITHLSNMHNLKPDKEYEKKLNSEKKGGGSFSFRDIDSVDSYFNEIVDGLEVKGNRESEENVIDGAQFEEDVSFDEDDNREPAEHSIHLRNNRGRSDPMGDLWSADSQDMYGNLGEDSAVPVENNAAIDPKGILTEDTASSQEEPAEKMEEGRDFEISLSGKIHIDGGKNGQPMSISIEAAPGNSEKDSLVAKHKSAIESPPLESFLQRNTATVKNSRRNYDSKSKHRQEPTSENSDTPLFHVTHSDHLYFNNVDLGHILQDGKPITASSEEEDSPIFGKSEQSTSESATPISKNDRTSTSSTEPINSESRLEAEDRDDSQEDAKSLSEESREKTQRKSDNDEVEDAEEKVPSRRDGGSKMKHRVSMDRPMLFDYAKLEISHRTSSDRTMDSDSQTEDSVRGFGEAPVLNDKINGEFVLNSGLESVKESDQDASNFPHRGEQRRRERADDTDKKLTKYLSTMEPLPDQSDIKLVEIIPIDTIRIAPSASVETTRGNLTADAKGSPLILKIVTSEIPILEDEYKIPLNVKPDATEKAKELDISKESHGSEGPGLDDISSEVKNLLKTDDPALFDHRKSFGNSLFPMGTLVNLKVGTKPFIRRGSQKVSVFTKNLLQVPVSQRSKDDRKEMTSEAGSAKNDPKVYTSILCDKIPVSHKGPSKQDVEVSKEKCEEPIGEKTSVPRNEEEYNRETSLESCANPVANEATEETTQPEGSSYPGQFETPSCGKDTEPDTTQCGLETTEGQESTENAEEGTKDAKKKVAEVENMLAIMEFMKKVEEMMAGDVSSPSPDKGQGGTVLQVERVVILPQNQSDIPASMEECSSEEAETTPERVVLMGEGVKHVDEGIRRTDQQNRDATSKGPSVSLHHDPLGGHPKPNLPHAGKEKDKSFLFYREQNSIMSAAPLGNLSRVSERMEDAPKLRENEDIQQPLQNKDRIIKSIKQRASREHLSNKVTNMSSIKNTRTVKLDDSLMRLQNTGDDQATKLQNYGLFSEDKIKIDNKLPEDSYGNVFDNLGMSKTEEDALENLLSNTTKVDFGQMDNRSRGQGEVMIIGLKSETLPSSKYLEHVLNLENHIIGNVKSPRLSDPVSVASARTQVPSDRSMREKEEGQDVWKYNMGVHEKLHKEMVAQKLADLQREKDTRSSTSSSTSESTSAAREGHHKVKDLLLNKELEEFKDLKTESAMREKVILRTVQRKISDRLRDLEGDMLPDKATHSKVDLTKLETLIPLAANEISYRFSNDLLDVSNVYNHHSLANLGTNDAKVAADASLLKTARNDRLSATDTNIPAKIETDIESSNTMDGTEPLYFDKSPTKLGFDGTILSNDNFMLDNMNKLFRHNDGQKNEDVRNIPKGRSAMMEASETVGNRSESQPLNAGRINRRETRRSRKRNGLNRDWNEFVDKMAKVNGNEKRDVRNQNKKKNSIGSHKRKHQKYLAKVQRKAKGKRRKKNKHSKKKRKWWSFKRRLLNVPEDQVPLKLSINSGNSVKFVRPQASGMSIQGLEMNSKRKATLEDSRRKRKPRKRRHSRRKRQLRAGGAQIRGGQDCMDRRHPSHVNAATFQESAHCLRFSDLWYSVYELENPIMEHTVYLQLFEKHTLPDGSTHWDDHTQGAMVRLGTFIRHQRDSVPTIAFTYSGAKMVPQKQAHNLDPTRDRLLVPSPVAPQNLAKYPEVKGGTGEYLVVQSNAIGKDGSECDRAGVGFTAFATQPDRCSRVKGTCLKNQPLAYWRHDMEAREAGRPGCYFLSNFASVPDNPIKYNVSGSGSREFLGLEYHSQHVSAIDIEVKADYNAIVRVGSSGRVTEVYVDSTAPEHTVVTVVISNMGLASSPYQPRISDCPTGLPVSWQKAKGTMQVIAPQHDQRVTLDLYGQLYVNEFHCSVEVVNHRGELVAMRRIRIQKMDRCFCVWHCLCACVGSVSGLGCQPMSPEHYHAAGFQGPVPVVSMEPSMMANAIKDVLLFSALLVLLLLLLGMLKWFTGIFVPAVGRWGLDSLMNRSRLEEYYESELKCRCLMTDDTGNPIHPDTGQRTVRICNRKVEFFLNLFFFLTYPIAICCNYVKRSFRSGQPDCCPDESKMCLLNEKDGCPKLICVNTYGDTRNSKMEAEDTKYVMNELKRSQESLQDSGKKSKRSSILRSVTSSRKSSRKSVSVGKYICDLLKKRVVFRNLSEPIGGLNIAPGVCYSLRGYFMNAENEGYRFITPCPFKQHWLIENNKKKPMKPPQLYASNLFMRTFSTAKEVYDSNEISTEPWGYCINVQFFNCK